MAFVQHLVASSPSSSTCRRFIMSHALQNHPPSMIPLQCSLSNAQNCTRVISFRSKVLTVKSGTKVYPSRNDNDAHLSSSLSVKLDIKYKSFYFGMPISVSSYGFRNQTCYIHNASVRKPISMVPRAAIFMTEDEAGGKICSFDKFNNKNGKGVKARATQKRSVISVDEVGTNATKEKAAALKDVDSLQLEGQTVESDVNSVISKSKRTSKTKEKVKQAPRSKKTVKKASAATALTDAAEPPIKSRKKSQESSEMNATSSTLTVTEVVKEGDVSKSDGGKKAEKNSIKKLKPATKSSKKVTKQPDGKVSHVQYSHVTNVAMSQRHDAWPQLYPPLTKSVLVVESVTKAKVIQGYLGETFEVLPSYGHVRDLAARSGSVRPDDDFSMVWEVPSAAWSHLKSIKVALSGADNLILASDPDREGEAIAWHIIEMLKQQDALRENVTVARVVFNQITESSIKTALQTPRVIDANLVHAYLARRALDYLIGFNVSPLLWRKLPGCQSAGRVQSAALALICDREKEIQEFKAQEYWTVGVEFHKNDPSSSNPISLMAHLTHSDSKKLNQLSITSQEEANEIKGKINASTFEVVSSKLSKTRRNPPAPYITSTLQQDAANKFNFTASYTMKVAQKLYEGIQLSNDKAAGLITYMRTDGLHLSDEAAKDIQSFVAEKYGQDFASKVVRKFFKKVKNAQEAHEAIRPTDIRRLPSNLFGALDEDSVKLYSLIWSRTMACQMEPAIVGQIQVDIGNASQSTLFRSTCSRVEFLGYKAAYEDAEITPLRNSKDEEEKRNVVYETLSKLKNGQSLSLSKVEIDQHHTQPPPRYSEGSLVKKMEELGIGRPSTYASTIKVLKDRNYIKMENRMICPEFRGRMVSAFLSHYFSEVTDYSFTADMETELDNVSDGMTEWKGLLKDYWTRFRKYCELAGNVHIHQVEKMLENTFGDFLFSSIPDGKRNCPSCMEGTLIFKVSRYGAGYFIGCDQHPKCKYIAKTLYGEEDEEENSPENKRTDLLEPKLLGLNPGSNEQVLLKCGPYGYYVQQGEDRKGHLPKRASASRIKDVSSITLEDALELLKYPVTLGKHPDDDQPIVLRLAKAGFAISHRRNNVSVPKNLKRSEINMEKALELLQSEGVRRRGRPKREVVEAL